MAEHPALLAAVRTEAASDEVVASEHVNERNERNDRRDRPRQLFDESHVATDQEIDPDKHHRDRVEDAEDQLRIFFIRFALERSHVATRGSGRRHGLIATRLCRQPAARERLSTRAIKLRVIATRRGSGARGASGDALGTGSRPSSQPIVPVLNTIAPERAV